MHGSGFATKLPPMQRHRWPLIASLMTNDGNALRSAALSGAGFVLQPEVLLEEHIREGRLVRVLDAFLAPARQVNPLYLPDPRPRRKLMSLVNWILHRYADEREATGFASAHYQV